MKNKFTVKQLAKIFSIKESMIYRWCNEGKVIFEKKCGRLRIDFSSVKKMFDNMPEERYIPKEKQALYQIPDDYDYTYFTTSDGKVVNFSTKKVLSQRVCDDGYVRVWLYQDGERQAKLVHCLVYETQGDNVLNKRHIHHINSNRADNRIQNLIAVTSAQHGELHRLLKAGKTAEYRALIRTIRKENKQKLYEVPFEDGLVLRVTKEQLDLYKKGVTSEELFRRKAFVRVFATNRKG